MVTIKIKKTVPKVPQETIVKRTAGQRAGLTSSAIAGAAYDHFLSKGPEGITFRGLAAKLKVTPTTVRAHFKGDMEQLQNAVAGQVLDELAPAYAPNQSAEAYLVAFFHRAIVKFGGHPGLGQLLVLQLCDDPLLSLRFAERAAVTMAAIAPEISLETGIRLLIERLTAVVLVETRWSAMEDEGLFAATLKSRLAKATQSDYPALVRARKAIDTGAAESMSAKPVEERASAAAEAVIAALKSG